MTSRHQYGNEVRHGGAGDEEAGRTVGESEQGSCPLGDLPLDLDGRMIAAPAIGVEARGQHVREHAHGAAPAMNPAHESRMHVPGGVGHHVAKKILVDPGKIRWMNGPSAAQVGARGRIHGLPHRAGANMFDVVEHVVEHAVPLPAKVLPIRRV
jgi:hypothetical protein